MSKDNQAIIDDMTLPPKLPEAYYDVPSMWYNDPFFYENDDYLDTFDTGKYFCSTMYSWDTPDK